MPTYEFREDGATYESVQAENLEEAVAEARASFDESLYDASGGTLWIDIYVVNEGDADDAEKITITVQPEAPKCEEGAEHEWTSPEWLGGLKENPGVWGHGGGVKIVEVCEHCGCARHTDTWASRPDTGKQGLRSVRYEPGYAAEHGPDSQ